MKRSLFRNTTWTTTVMVTLALGLNAGQLGCSSSKTQDGELSSDSEEGDSMQADGSSTSTPAETAQATASNTTANQPSNPTATPATGAKPTELKTEAFQVGDDNVNSYYFVRSKAENWKALAQKIYGDASQVDKLKKWNEGVKPAPGKAIYYSSSQRKADTAMKSFYEDTGVALEPYVVKAGDKLSGIAKERYGNYNCWKEIMAANPELKSVDEVKPGVTLQLPPGGAPVVETASASVPKDAAPHSAVKEVPPTTASAPVTAPANPPQTPTAATEAHDPSRKIASAEETPATPSEPSRSPSAMERIKSFTDGKPWALPALGGVAILALAGWLIQKRRNA